MTVEDNAMHLGDLLRLYLHVAGRTSDYAYADLLRDFKFSILNHITLVFAIGVDGYDERRAAADWKYFALCRVMLRRLVRCIWTLTVSRVGPVTYSSPLQNLLHDIRSWTRCTRGVSAPLSFLPRAALVLPPPPVLLLLLVPPGRAT